MLCYFLKLLRWIHLLYKIFKINKSFLGNINGPTKVKVFMIRENIHIYHWLLIASSIEYKLLTDFRNELKSICPKICAAVGLFHTIALHHYSGLLKRYKYVILYLVRWRDFIISSRWRLHGTFTYSKILANMSAIPLIYHVKRISS